MGKFKVYLWKRKTTGEIVEHTDYALPPDDSGEWLRVYCFGVGNVSGAGNSPTRSSVRYR